MDIAVGSWKFGAHTESLILDDLTLNAGLMYESLTISKTSMYLLTAFGEGKLKYPLVIKVDKF